MTYEVAFTDARGVLAKAGPYLAKEPVLHTVLTTMAHRLVAAPAVAYPRWFAIGFNEFGHAAAEQAGHSVERHGESVSVAEVTEQIAGGGIRLWVDGGPVHVSAGRPPSFGVARIGPVYTPPEHRGRGCAGATVHALAGQLLAEGARVCLFADQANPISTRLYESLGFRALAETALVALVD